MLTEGEYILQLFTLWTWLPVRITMYQPVLLYTTEEHGCSLTTFYVRVEHHEPTVLMIKTCNNEVCRPYLFLDTSDFVNCSKMMDAMFFFYVVGFIFLQLRIM